MNWHPDSVVTLEVWHSPRLQWCIALKGSDSNGNPVAHDMQSHISFLGAAVYRAYELAGQYEERPASQRRRLRFEVDYPGRLPRAR